MINKGIIANEIFLGEITKTHSKAKNKEIGFNNNVNQGQKSRRKVTIKMQKQKNQKKHQTEQHPPAKNTV